jgi:hypothetical protein
VKLKTKLTGLLAKRIDYIEGFISVNPIDDTIPNGDRRNGVPAALCVSDLSDKLIVFSDPSAALGRFALGMPKSGIFVVSCNFILEAFKNPRNIFFCSTEIKSGVSAVELIY